jgi:hypothetical protein
MEMKLNERRTKKSIQTDPHEFIIELKTSLYILSNTVEAAS